jgi:hypothetical protein
MNAVQNVSDIFATIYNVIVKEKKKKCHAKIDQKSRIDPKKIMAG